MTILGHIQACPTRFLAQETFVILKKRWPNEKLFLARRACSSLALLARVFFVVSSLGLLQYSLYDQGIQAYLAKKSFLFGHHFSNITNVSCAKKRVGHACICPTNHNGYWPASFEVIRLDGKNVFQCFWSDPQTRGFGQTPKHVFLSVFGPASVS